MRLRSTRFALLGALCLVAAGCDSFSLPDQFLLPGEGAEALSLTVDSETTQRNGTVALTASGGIKPYSFDEPSPVDLYGNTSSQGLGFVLDAKYVAGGAIGTIRITVRDAEGSTAYKNVTVLPPAPTLTGTRTGSGTTATLSWNYVDWGIIDSIELQRSSDAMNFGTITTATANGSYPENSLVSTTEYTYRIIAKAGAFVSLPVSLSLAPL